jgi:hypothetical protein
MIAATPVAPARFFVHPIRSAFAAMPRTDFNSSRLVRLLAAQQLLPGDAAGPAFAERLGDWLNVADAMRLYAAHNQVEPAADTSAVVMLTPAAVLADFDRDCTGLEAAIVRACTPGAPGRIRLPMPDAELPREVAADYEPYRRFHLAQQRVMETAIAPLRARLRSALANCGPELAKLATLDANFDDILAGRELRLLAAVPALLEKRFVQLRDAHFQAFAASGQADAADDVATWLQPQGWLTRYIQLLQAALLAELELRLQPAAGLAAALRTEVSPPQ